MQNSYKRGRGLLLFLCVFYFAIGYTVLYTSHFAFVGLSRLQKQKKKKNQNEGTQYKVN